MNTSYVLGFAFNPDYSNVALILKQHPAWQAGYMNGIGGKIEMGENSTQAMVREFQEETGILWMAWELVASMGSPLFSCKVFRTVLPSDKFAHLKTTTDEKVVLVFTSDVLRVRERYLSNIPHLIGLCLDPDLSGVQNIWYKHGNENGPKL